MNPPRNRFDVPLLILLTVASFTLRCRELQDPLWLDELHTAWSVAGGPGMVADRAAAGNHGPVTFYLAWLSTSLAGQNRFALRLPFLIAGGLLAPVLYVLIRGLSPSPACALMASCLATLDYFGLMFSQEARPYAVVMLLAVLQVFVFMRLARPEGHADRRLRLAFVVLSVLLIYSHYTTALHLVAIGGAWVALMVLQRRHFLVLEFLAIGACCLPATSHVMEISSRRMDWTFIAKDPSFLSVGGMYRLDLLVALPWLTVTLIAGLRFALGKSKSPAVRARFSDCPITFSDVLILTAWTIGPLLAAWLLTVTDTFRLFLHRYTISSSQGAICLGSFALLLLPTIRLRNLAGALITAILIMLLGVLPHLWEGTIHQRDEDWREMAQLVRQRDPQGQKLLFLCPGLIEDVHLGFGDPELRDYCLFPLNGFYEFPQPASKRIPRPTSSDAVDHVVAARIHKEGQAWFLIRAGETTRKSILRELRIRMPRVRIKETRRGGLTLVHVEVEAAGRNAR